MLLIQFLLAFTFSTSAYAIPDSPVDANGGAGGTNTGNALGSALGSVAAVSSATSFSTSSTSSQTSSATSSSGSTASPKVAAAAMLPPDWAVAGGLAVVVGGAAII